MDDLLKDKRFAHVAKDPRFRKMPVGERKVKIDKRFKGMFTDKRFKLKYTVDKRGKPVNLTTNENLKKYYALSDEDSSESENNEDCESTVVNDSTAAENNERDTHVMDSRKKKKTLSKSVLKHDSDDSLNSSDDSDSHDYEDDDIGVDICGRDNDKKSGSIDPRFHMKKDIDTDRDNNRKKKKSESVDPRFEMKISKNSRQKLTKRKDKVRVDEPVLNDKGKSMRCKKVVTQGVTDDDSEVDIDESENGSSVGSSGDENSDDEVEQKPTGKDSGVDFARGEGNMYSSSSDADESDVDIDDTDIESKFDHRWGEADENVVSLEEATCRLAVCNMDWDRMKAKDIYVLLNSFKPTNGIIKSVKVYPSEFGKERMAEEARHGPRELKDLKMDSEEERDDVAQEGTSFQREKLREYQLNRLRYYYAVVDCDTTDTADHVYTECDGIEYESSATKLDLRFIPDEETFEEAEVVSMCTEIPGNYKPQFFFNAALAQSKVELTWDETDRERVQLTSRQYSGKDDVAEEDLKAYLASSSDDEAPDYSAILGNAGEDGESGEESDEDRRIDKYKQLLTDIDTEEEKKKKQDVEMEISWEPGLREATENIVKKKKQTKDSTVWEDYLQKKKEKKKQRIEERKKKQKSQQESDSDNTHTEKEVAVAGETQAFSDDEVPADADMEAFMAEEKTNTKMKKNKKKKKKEKKTDEENAEISKETAELSLLLMDEKDNRKHFNLRDLVQEDGKTKKSKKKKKDKKDEDVDEEFQMNVTDPRFSAVFESHLFNIDPSAPEYRKTKGTEAIVSEKIKRSGKRDKNRDKTKRTLADREDEQVKKQKVMDKQTVNTDNLASLIKSVKSKTKHFQSNKANR